MPPQQAAPKKANAVPSPFLSRKKQPAAAAPLAEKPRALPAAASRLPGAAAKLRSSAGKRRKEQEAAGPATAKRRKESAEEDSQCQSSDDDDAAAAAASKGDASSSDNGSESEIVNIDFEFFDPRETDLPTFKNLLAALFDADAEMFCLMQLAELIVSQPLLGSTVKVNGIDSDPFAMLTVLNMNQHRDLEVMKQIKKYVVDKVKAKDPAFHSRLSKLLEDTSGKQNVGLLLTERLVNMPAQIAPPMFRMLVKEIQWAVDEKEPYDFTHYLLLSKTYRTVASDLLEVPDEDGEGRTVMQRKKKGKKKGEQGERGEDEFGKDLFYYAPEHEVVRQFAEHSCAFSFTHSARKTVADSRRAFHEFGIVPAMEAFLIPAAKLEPMIAAMEEIVTE